MDPTLLIWLPSLLASVLFLAAWGTWAWLVTHTGSCVNSDNCKQAGKQGTPQHAAVAGQQCVLVDVRAEAGAMNMEWQGIGCSYRIGGNTKVVLQDVWGKATPGKMQALMGPSGAGKSTLMDILALRKSVGDLTGCLLINGQPASSSVIKHTSYVPQEDTFIPTMTCDETLQFYAAVVLPDTCTRAQRRVRVHDVLAAVGLSNSSSTLVGGTLAGGMNLRGLSGGERRRLSIAAGILSEPAVLFLDEPTSGLDSFAALNVMGHLKRVAQATQQTVIATIHQPRSAIWEMFDTVSLLSSGCLMYHGPCQGIVPWFQSMGFLHSKGSESDWVLDLVATGFDKPAALFENSMRSTEDIMEAAKAFKQHYLTSLAIKDKNLEEGLIVVSDISLEQGCARPHIRRSLTTQSNLPQLGSKLTSLRAGGKGLTTEAVKRTYPAGWCRQVCALYSREMASITRNPADVIGRQVTFTMMALVTGLTFYRPLVGPFESLQARTNLVYWNLVAFVLLPFVSLSLYTNDKKLYLADVSAKLYRPGAFYVAKVLATTPFYVFSILTYAGITYGMGGLRPTLQAFSRFTLTLTLLFLTSSQVLHLSAIITPNYDAAFGLALLWCTPQFLCNSYFVRYTQTGLQWFTQVRYVLAGYFAMEGLVQNELQGGTLDCGQGFDKQLLSFLKKGMVSATPMQRSVLDQLARPQPGCVFDANAAVDMLGYSYSFAVTAGCLLAYLLVLHALTYLALVLVARKERR